jgi:DNA-binding transcriptional MerR regulator
MNEAWTLAELVQRAARALVAADVRAPNGRVTEVPDARMIRWYTTTGLVDRPVMRGRVATYGERHLLQLVAVKRLQARGLTLAEIQQRLAGAPDAALRSAAATTEPAAGKPAPAPEPAQEQEQEQEHEPADRPASRTAERPEPDASRRTRPRFWANPTRASAVAASLDSGRDSVNQGAGDEDHLLYGLRIADLTLLLRARPGEADLPAIRAAAQPLIDLLASRDLITPNPSDDRKGGPA